MKLRTSLFSFNESTIKSGFAFLSSSREYTPVRTAMQPIFAVLAAFTPKIESSTTTHFSGLLLSLRAHFKKISGLGFGSVISSAVRVASKNLCVLVILRRLLMTS